MEAVSVGPPGSEHLSGMGTMWTSRGRGCVGLHSAIWRLHTHAPALLSVTISPLSASPHSSWMNLIHGALTCGSSVGSAWKRSVHV